MLYNVAAGLDVADDAVGAGTVCCRSRWPLFEEDGGGGKMGCTVSFNCLKSFECNRARFVAVKPSSRKLVGRKNICGTYFHVRERIAERIALEQVVRGRPRLFRCYFIHLMYSLLQRIQLELQIQQVGDDATLIFVLPVGRLLRLGVCKSSSMNGRFGSGCTLRNEKVSLSISEANGLSQAFRRSVFLRSKSTKADENARGDN